MYKFFLVLFFSILSSYSQNNIFNDFPVVKKKESKRFFKSSEDYSKIVINRASSFKIDLKKCVYSGDKLVTAAYRALGPDNYKNYNKRLGYMDYVKTLDDVSLFLRKNSFKITFESPNYKDVISFFENFETLLIEANNEKVRIKLIPIEHDMNYSLYFEISSLD